MLLQHICVYVCMRVHTHAHAVNDAQRRGGAEYHAMQRMHDANDVYV